jgi:hypothetical protein
MAYSAVHPLTEQISDGTAASVATGVSGVVRAPFRGKLIEAGTMIGSTIATADATCTLSIAGTAVTGGSFVITQSGSAIGDLDFAAISGVGNNGVAANSTITAANTCNEGDLVKFAFTGSGTGGGNVYCYAVFVRT